MITERLPSIIRNSHFNERGLVVEGTRLLVPAYVGSQKGFSSDDGRKFLDNDFYPNLRERGVLPLCPFTACAEYLDLSKLDDDMSYQVHWSFWDAFNRNVGPVNYEILMPHAKFMIALFDGSHSVDDGTSAEVAFFAPHYGPVIGIRSDFRLAENIAAPINPAVRYFMDNGPYHGQFFCGPTAYDDAYNGIEGLVKQVLNGSVLFKPQYKAL